MHLFRIAKNGVFIGFFVPFRIEGDGLVPVGFGKREIGSFGRKESAGMWVQGARSRGSWALFAPYLHPVHIH